MSEADIEKEIQAKGLNAPRLTPAMIDAAIRSVQFWNPPTHTTLTVCVMKLRNGFTVIGESAAASPENFDREVGCKIASENAHKQIWQLEGYLLRERLSNGALIEQHLFQFAAWLSCRQEVATFGASLEAGRRRRQLVQEFIDTQMTHGGPA